MLLLNLFLIFFLFDLKKLKTLNDFKNNNNVMSLSIWISILLLSFAGVPPLLGFVSKFLIFISIFFKKNLFLFFIFIFFNIVIIYFYIQNLRFIISYKNSVIFLKKNYRSYFNANISYILNFLNFLNLCGILFFEEVLIYFSNTIMNINF